jgi:putative OPT family oligopeptide transporter
MMQMVGVVSAAVVMAPILNLLLNGYGIGEPTATHPDPLQAPQATLMSLVAIGVFEHNLPWNLIAIGAGIGLLIIILDQFQASRGASFRIPVLAVAVGLYLPFELDASIGIGGLIAYLVTRIRKRKLNASHEAAAKHSDQTGLLFASGLITGEALVGIGLAIPIVASGDPQFLDNLTSLELPTVIGIAAFLGVCVLLGVSAIKAYRSYKS